ncbi:LIC_10705 family lipoprotein [Leptospira noguchii]|uniref:Lipoprotein n=1 Tax=Leptospira noguchii serovar Autumnalis str. ZUN142 TaxID=1085540 RepID=M6U874_9LEPT|nr:LIC_10705 family lipoprotein [Leptospira noguchii]EMO41227.1 hypothetical protein LEP1GSC186_3022 [Leptospira noguchii serovar Autumnalis str. ZUN142]UOG49347.1 LIC_10705 family lipoprotein [Leptospira noguchii]
MKKILCLIFVSYFSFDCSLTRESSHGNFYNEFMLEYSIFFILPNLDLNQYCPPTEEIPILEPGTYTRYMSEGDTYIFDNRARLNTLNSYSGSSELFTFSFRESPSQNIKLVSPHCGQSPNDYPSSTDTGSSGQLETVYIGLKVPPLEPNRYGYFTKLKAVSGSGTVTFTTPNVPDPPEAH